MNRKSLGFLGIVVAATALMRTGASDASQGAATINGVPAPPGSAGASVCGNEPDPDGPWKAARSYFQLRHPIAADTCQPDANNRFPCVPLDAKTRFLIATVPDPDATHLALYFDRNVESLLWAVSDAGYSFERYWLPWRTEAPKDLFLLQDQQCQKRQSERRHTLPGLLVFRDKSSDGTLFLFLVGETPTSGVNNAEWKNALQYVRGMKPMSQDGRLGVDVIGPSFSGSLAPLAADLKTLAKAGDDFHFISGMVTNGEAIEGFRGAIKGFGEYESVIEGDDRASYLFLQFVSEMWKPPKALAVLAEDETAYGALPLKDAPGLAHSNVLSFRYPREISRLRNSYQETSGAPQAGRVSPAAPGIQLTLKDAASDADMVAEKDTVPAFSRLQSPASQQAVLSTVSRTLRRERVDLGGIVATDILDALFLSRFLRTVSPDTRVFTLDSDLLFLPQSDPAAPMGLLSITSYPLLSRHRHRTPETGRVSNVTRFASRYAQGTYNACGSLLGDRQGREVVQEYGAQPPLWLTAVGRDGYWPIAILDDRASYDPRVPASILRRAKNNPEQDKAPYLESPAWGWFVVFWVSTLLGILHCVYSIYLWMGPHQPKRKDGARGEASRTWATTFFTLLGKLFRDYPDGRGLLCAPERAFLSCISIAAACGVFLVAEPLARFLDLPAFHEWAPWYLGIADGLIFMLVVTAIGLTFGRPLDVWRRHQAYRAFVGFGCLAAGYLAVIWSGLLWKPEYQTGYYFAYRCLSLTSGVAPVLPMLLVTVGFLWWASARLKCAAMIEEREDVKGRLPPEALAAPLIKHADESIGDLFCFRVWAPAIPFLLVWFQLFVPFRSFRSLEHRNYDNLYTVVVLLFYWAVAVAWMQFLWCWDRLKALLQWLERQPVRNAFTRLPKEGSWVPLVTAPRERPLFITSRCSDCLNAILSFDLAAQSWPEIDRHRRLTGSLKNDAVEIRRLLSDSETSLSSGLPVDRSTYATLQVHMESVARTIIQDLEASEWRRGASDSLSAQNASAGDSASKPLLVLKEEFIALRMLIYLRYVFRHLRVLLGFVIGGFVLTVLSMSSYPFQGHRWIGGSNAAVCLALGLGVVAVFAQMDRDAIMSRITATKANELGSTFFLRVAQYGVLPLLTVLSSQFPEINRFLFSWLQPAIEAIK